MVSNNSLPTQRAELLIPKVLIKYKIGLYMTAVSVILSLNPHLATDLACNYFNLLKVSSKCVTYIYKQRIHTSTENSNEETGYWRLIIYSYIAYIAASWAQPCKDIVVLVFWVDIIHVYGKVWEKSLGLFKVSFMTSCDTIRNRKNS